MEAHGDQQSVSVRQLPPSVILQARAAKELEDKRLVVVSEFDNLMKTAEGSYYVTAAMLSNLRRPLENALAEAHRDLEAAERRFKKLAEMLDEQVLVQQLDVANDAFNKEREEHNATLTKVSDLQREVATHKLMLQARDRDINALRETARTNEDAEAELRAFHTTYNETDTVASARAGKRLYEWTSRTDLSLLYKPSEAEVPQRKQEESEKDFKPARKSARRR